MLVEDRMSVDELVSTSGVAIIVGIWGSESVAIVTKEMKTLIS